MSAGLSPAKENRAVTVLMNASESGDSAAVEAQLAASADVNFAVENGMTPLMSAAASGHLGIVSLLIDRGADINATRNDGLTALALAAFFGHESVVRELLGHGADVEAKSRFGTLPEMWARSRGFTGITKLLRDVRSKKMVHAEEPDRSELVCIGQSRRAEEIEGATHSNQVSSNDSQCSELADTPLEMSPASGSLFGDDDDVGKTIADKPASMLDEMIPITGDESASLDAAGAGADAALNQVISEPAPRMHVPRRYPNIPLASQSSFTTCLAKITSDWQRITLATSLVIFMCGIATLFVLERTNARNVPQTPPLANKSEQSTGAETPVSIGPADAPNLSDNSPTSSPSTSADRSFGKRLSKPIGENRTKTDKQAATRLAATAEKKDRHNSREIFGKIQRSKTLAASEDSSPLVDTSGKKTPVKSASGSAERERVAQSEELHPAPLSVEVRRPSVSPKPISERGSIITSGNEKTKAKVIRWP